MFAARVTRWATSIRGGSRAPHHNAIWQLDFTGLRVGSELRYLPVIEADFSRFVVGHILAEGPSSEAVVTVLRDATRLYDKPERVYTDCGTAFDHLARRLGTSGRRSSAWADLNADARLVVI